MKKLERSSRLLIASGVLCMASAAMAEDVYVKLPIANVLAGKGAGTDRVVQLKRGDKLQVVGKEGSWLKVKSGDKEGYVHENSVSSSKAADTGGLSKLLGGSDASSASSAEAGKGLGESLAYARSKGMSAAGLDRMIALRKTINGSDWTKFTAEGHVGPEKK